MLSPNCNVVAPLISTPARVAHQSVHLIQPVEPPVCLDFNSNGSCVHTEPYGVTEIASDYLRWVMDNRWICLLKDEPDTVSYLYLLASKRGNPIYANRVSKRFDEAVCQLHQLSELPSAPNQCRIFSLTLTFARNISLFDAWKNVGAELNRFKSRLVRCYGKVFLIRVNEAHADGFVHLQCLIIFLERTFRIERYPLTPLYMLRLVEKSWGHGFVKLRAMVDAKQGIMYVAKYCQKTTSLVTAQQSKEPDKAILTLALNWYFRKRAFSISRLRLDIPRLHNSNIKYEKTPSEYFYMGVLTHQQLEADLEQMEISSKTPYTIRAVRKPMQIEPLKESIPHGFLQQFSGDSCSDMHREVMTHSFKLGGDD